MLRLDYVFRYKKHARFLIVNVIGFRCKQLLLTIDDFKELVEKFTLAS